MSHLTRVLFASVLLLVSACAQPTQQSDSNLRPGPTLGPYAPRANPSNVATVYARMTAEPSVRDNTVPTVVPTEPIANGSAQPLTTAGISPATLASGDTPSASGPPQTTIYCPDCQLIDVTGVIDGDTIDTSIGRLRFFGVDTPERGEECFTEATEYTQLLVGSQVRIEDGPRIEDTYKRRLAYVFDTSGNSIDVQLVAGGFATAWTRDGQYRDTLMELEKSAASNEAGCLWGEFVSTPAIEPTTTPSTLPTRIIDVPTSTIVATYQPTEIDFLRAWGAREPWIPLPASRSFSGWIDETDVVFRLYTAIWVIETSNYSGVLTRDSFVGFVSGSPLDLSVRSRQALLALLEHPKALLVNAPWMYEPRSSREASLGCALAYVEGRRRYGAFLETLGTMVEYCEQGFTPWVTYLSLSEGERDRDWIEYAAHRVAGID